MGSHYVRVYSLDEGRVRTSLGSGDRQVLQDWLRAIRNRKHVAEEDLAGHEEAAKQLIAGFQPGVREDGHHFGFAFLALCEAWADRKAVVECYVTKTFQALWELAAEAGPNPFGVPQSPYAAGHVGWHEPAAVPALRRGLASVDSEDPSLVPFGGTTENVVLLDGVLAHAENAGRGVIVSWAV